MNKKLTRLWATKNKNDEWWSSFVTSPLAIVINYFVVDIQWISPNLITLLSFLTAILSALFIIVGGELNFIIAAFLIQWCHILDCMDGQMARYRKKDSLAGSFFDKLTDQIQVIIWFGSVGYAAYVQSQSILPIFLAFTGVAFYCLRGYIKYVAIYIIASKDSEYLEKSLETTARFKEKKSAGLGVLDNFFWFMNEQKKFFCFNEGVFIFMLSLALIIDKLIPMLWLFAISQLYHGLVRGWKKGCQMKNSQHPNSESLSKNAFRK